MRCKLIGQSAGVPLSSAAMNVRELLEQPTHDTGAFWLITGVLGREDPKRRTGAVPLAGVSVASILTN